MAKFLIQGTYTAEGAKGLLKDGGTKRVRAVQETLKALGGKVETFHFAFGETDTFVIVDLPDNASAAAVSLAFGSSGRAHIRTTALITPEEIDAAAKKKLPYKAPGK
jgi:uncharacterized protein with GYD domain